MAQRPRSIVSLGGGCDIGLILKWYGLREGKFPFDWLWNLDAGLVAVAALIDSEFKNARKKNDFRYDIHAARPNNKTLIIKQYPTVAHIHSDPFENPVDLENFNNQIQDFFDLLNDSETETSFLYYRNVSNNELMDVLVARVALEKIIQESIQLTAVLDSKFPMKKYNLLSLMALPSAAVKRTEVHEELKALCLQHSKPSLTFDVVLERRVEKRSFMRPIVKLFPYFSWHQALRRAGVVSHIDLLLIMPRQLTYRLKKMRSSA